MGFSAVPLRTILLQQRSNHATTPHLFAPRSPLVGNSSYNFSTTRLLSRNAFLSVYHGDISFPSPRVLGRVYSTNRFGGEGFVQRDFVLFPSLVFVSCVLIPVYTYTEQLYSSWLPRWGSMELWSPWLYQIVLGTKHHATSHVAEDWYDQEGICGMRKRALSCLNSWACGLSLQLRLTGRVSLTRAENLRYCESVQCCAVSQNTGMHHRRRRRFSNRPRKSTIKPRCNLYIIYIT